MSDLQEVHMTREVAIRKMITACQANPDLHAKLLEKPHEVAKEYGVTLEPEELQQLQRVKRLNDLVAEFTNGRGIDPHIGYPIDVLWKNTIFNHIVFYRPYYPIWFGLYPVGYYFSRGEIGAGRRFSGLRKVRS
jgi:hypothetical protein